MFGFSHARMMMVRGDDPSSSDEDEPRAGSRSRAGYADDDDEKGVGSRAAPGDRAPKRTSALSTMLDADPEAAARAAQAKGEDEEEIVSAEAARGNFGVTANKKTRDDGGGALDEVPEGMCVECTDQLATVACDQCVDDFCEVCFMALHKRGRRKTHNTRQINNKLLLLAPGAGALGAATASTASTSSATTTSTTEEEDGGGDEPTPMEATAARIAAAAAAVASAAEADDPAAAIDMSREVEMVAGTSLPAQLLRTGQVGSWFLERARYVPMRLSLRERKQLRLLESALSVSEYTDKVDIYSMKSKTVRIHTQLKDICAILSGLLVASDYAAGQRLIEDRQFEDNADFFQDIFEIGRRHKIMNPEKMRTEYGKLVYLLMDSVRPEIHELLRFSCVRPLRTVYTVLEAGGALAMLRDPQMAVATAEVLVDAGGAKARHVVQREIKAKESAVDYLARRYANEQLSADELKNCLYSISDNHSYLTSNRDPVERMLAFLQHYFQPTASTTDGARHSLSIAWGQRGARLTHSHERQYHYVLQSLTLWRDIAFDMFRLWYLAESDLLEAGNGYRLTDTGQGLNRMQQAPRISRAIHQVLRNAQTKVHGEWVGSSVIHLGDHNVPNALMFIDKYTQVSRILNPIVLVVEQIGVLCARSDSLRRYVDDAFGGVEELRRDILGDFFRHGFDGSGADNFFDAGSCIDGRLTSTWNWCSQLEKKAFFPVFKLCGFNGFDGEFAR